MAAFIPCNENTFVELCKRLELLLSFIQQYRWIIEAYVSDFYTHNHWSKIPPVVKVYVDATDPPDWAWLLEERKDHNTPVSKRISPLILLCLKAYSSYLSVKRTAVDLDAAETIECVSSNLKAGNQRQDLSSNSKQRVGECSHDVNVTAFQPPRYKNGQCMDMQHIFRKHVKPKKQHEIQKLGQSIHLLSGINKCTNVIDVGAGLGHLSRLLTFCYGLKVTTVEADGGHAPKASDFDRELKKDVHKKYLKLSTSESSSSNTVSWLDSSSIANPDASPVDNDNKNSTPSSLNAPPTTQLCSAVEELPSHVVCHIGHDIDTSYFLDIVKQNRAQVSSEAGEDKYILTGLHACGDLSPSLMRLFVESPSFVGLASVPCCYMKMEHVTTGVGAANHCVKSYPMSKCLHEIPNHDLNYETREMACHSADAYCQRLKENTDHLKVHSYRAALQYLLTKTDPNFQSGQVRLVTKKGAHKCFLNYATEILKKLNKDILKVPQAMLDDCENMTKHWKRVVAFYTIRLSLAPVVESLILLDRILALREKAGLLRSSILKDLRNKRIMAQIWSLAVVGKTFSGPWMTKFYSSAMSNLEMGNLVQLCMAQLQTRIADVGVLLQPQINVFGEQIDGETDDVISCILNYIADDEEIQRGSLESALLATQSVLSRQLVDFVNGGKYLNPSRDILDRAASAPTHNISSERTLGSLDRLWRRAPNATMGFLSGKVRCKMNKTLQWLDSNPPNQRLSLISFAVRHTKKDRSKKVLGEVITRSVITDRRAEVASKQEASKRRSLVRDLNKIFAHKKEIGTLQFGDTVQHVITYQSNPESIMGRLVNFTISFWNFGESECTSVDFKVSASSFYADVILGDILFM